MKTFNYLHKISLIGCGLLQAHYAFQNISLTSYNSIIHFTKMLRYVLKTKL